MQYEYFIGLRYLRAKRRQTFVSVITAIAVAGVTVGVAALIIVLSGMVGVQEYMRDKILGFNAHLIVSRFNGIADPAEAMRKIVKVPGVTGASPFIEGQVMLRGRSRSLGAMIRGIDAKTVGRVMSIGDHIVRGSIAELSNPTPGPDDSLPVIAVGEDMASEIGVFLDDDLTVIVPEGTLTPLGMRPRALRFRVGAIFKFGFYQVDSSVALVDMAVAKSLLQTENVDGIEVKVQDIYQVSAVQAGINRALGGSYVSSTWMQQQKQLFAALKMEQLLSSLVLSLIMLVAAFNIVSMLLMVVMEKFRDIAILKSMGATDAGIMRIFIVQGAVIGVFGALCGVALGVAVCLLQIRYGFLRFDETVYQFSVVPMKLELANILLVAGGAMLVSFLTTLYPSWQAARMRPAESLRYE
jgi:lipoprotein-releasing system permease protein